MSDKREIEYKELLKKLKKNADLRRTCCEFCSKDLSRYSYIQCAVCTSFNVCVNCFSQGLGKGAHARFHSYYFIDSHNFPLFSSGWTAKEEFLLLDNLIRFRLGNWQTISEAMGCSKSAKECETHFKEVYFGKTVEELAEYQVLSCRDLSGFVQVKDVSNFQKFNAIRISDEVLTYDRRAEGDKGILADFAGYMPMRKDFDIEFENDFESCLADLDFYDDDRPSDISAKLKLLEAYQQVLNEREIRKTFVLDRWTLESKLEKKLRPNIFEKNSYFALKPAARLLPFEKHSSFAEGLAKEFSTKMLLDELKEARSKGVKTEEDFKRFLNTKKNNFPMKSKEYEILIKEPFAYKQGQDQSCEILKKLEGFEGNSQNFSKKVALTKGQVDVMMDRIVSNLESRAGFYSEELVEDEKKELIDFIVKVRGDY